MSEATELAEREAAAAEATPGDDQPNDDDANRPAVDEEEEAAADDEAAAAAAAAQGIDQRELDRRMRAMDKETERHALAVAKIMGEDFDTVTDCPLCDFPGYVFPPGVREVDPLQRQAVLLAIGEEPEPELEQHPNYKLCDDCRGLGMVKTGATNPANWQLPCPRCDGRGYRSTVDAPEQAPVIPFPPPTPAPVDLHVAAVPTGSVTGYIDPATGAFVQVPPPR